MSPEPSDSGIDRKDFGLKSDEIFQIMQNREKKVSDNCMDVMMSKTKKITTGDLFKSMDLDVDLTKLNGIDNANSSELVRMAESLLGW